MSNWSGCEEAMIGRLNHVAIVVPDLRAAMALYRDALGATVLPPHALPEHGVTAAFVELGNTRIELLEPVECGLRGLDSVAVPAADLRRAAKTVPRRYGHEERDQRDDRLRGPRRPRARALRRRRQVRGNDRGQQHGTDLERDEHATR